MKSIKGSRTEQNLLKAFAGESQARNRYTYFASVAKKEGYEQIAGIFLETADQEKEHAKKFFKYLEGGNVTITAAYPAGVIGTTEENLKAAAMGENEEWSEMYPEFAKIGGALPQAAEPSDRRKLLHPRPRDLVAVPQLRICMQGCRSTEALPRMQAPAGILRAQARELLIRPPRGREKPLNKPCRSNRSGMNRW